MKKLEGKVALVTGAARGSQERLAADGASVAINYATSNRRSLGYWASARHYWRIGPLN